MKKNSYICPSVGFKSGCVGKPSPALLSAAVEAYIYGYPLVLMDVTRRYILAGGLSINQFLNERTFPTPEFKTIVRPNVDTLYSMAWLDLSREPVVMHVPDTHGTYYVMQLLDAWTNTFSSPGARTTGTKEKGFAIVGPGWEGVLPRGISRINSPTNTVWIIGRTQTDGPQAYPFVHALQDQYSLTPLNHWENPRVASAKGLENCLASYSRVSPKSQVEKMSAAAFFQTMMTAMNQNPPPLKDPAMNKRLARLGLIPGEDFDFHQLDTSVQLSLEYAVRTGPKLIEGEALKASAENQINGWNLILEDIGTYGMHYLRRAVVAMFGIGANLPQDAIYAADMIDKDKKLLEGSNNYILRFNQGQLPPVKAFWSVTLYNQEGFLTENPINRYAVSPHLGKLKYNRDGSLDIFIQNASPGIDLEPNWLPSPEGSFNLALRMYWPKAEVLTGSWQPPPVTRRK